MIALTWSVPRIDWLMPWLNSVTVRGWPANRSKKRWRSAGGRSQVAAIDHEIVAVVERLPETLGRVDAGVEKGLVDAARHGGNRRAGRSSARRRFPGCSGEVEVGLLAGLGAARVDHHQLGAARRSRAAWIRW